MTVYQSSTIWCVLFGMLRITQNMHVNGAKSYYSTADYYSEGQELTGRWRGAAARRLGLEGDVKQPDWDRACATTAS